MSEPKKKPILADHKKVGNSFIPPLLQITDIKQISWLDCALPELIWLGLLNEKYGLERGSEISLLLAETTQKVVHQESTPFPLYALASSYAPLPEEKWLEIAVELEPDGSLKEIRDGLSSLVTLYPECPLRSLFEKNSSEYEINDDHRRSLLERFKEILKDFCLSTKTSDPRSSQCRIYCLRIRKSENCRRSHRI